MSTRYDGPRPAKPGETPAVLGMISRIFLGDARHGMAREYPHLYGDMTRHPDWFHVGVQRRA